MARPPKGQRKVTEADVKRIAREQMQLHGTAGLTLRGIARELNVTAPAIYNYFHRLDDLITALIVDAFHMLAEAIEAAADDVDAEAVTPKLEAAMLAYRDWALAHPADFQLIYGNPIPGYTAPPAITVPAASRPLERIITLLVEGYHQGEIAIPPDYTELPPTVAAHLADFIDRLGVPIIIPPPLFFLGYLEWTRLHGMVMLELYKHTPPVVGDPHAFYANEVHLFLAQLHADDDRAAS